MKLTRFFALLVLLCVATSALAQHAAKGKPKNDDGAAAQPSAADANSTKLRAPTSDEAAELAAGLERALSQPTDLRRIDMGNGMIAFDLDGTHQDVALAKRNPDGTVALGCVDSVTQARGFLVDPSAAAAVRPKQPAPPVAGLEEK
ncbi:MAG: hypothetical protein HYX28_10400 [Candidatus Koribacter versatilis]|uniref:Secreted protein n=1 Tax=Candidatus Korobacter versatilis TaxID=658062 RepID=A0A932A9N7_9BACT|nr:hypothetical protein [Candidatus Koribacter versatilis]